MLESVLYDNSRGVLFHSGSIDSHGQAPEMLGYRNQLTCIKVDGPLNYLHMNPVVMAWREQNALDDHETLWLYAMGCPDVSRFCFSRDVNNSSGGSSGSLSDDGTVSPLSGDGTTPVKVKK